jgi:hypothetical protein
MLIYYEFVFPGQQHRASFFTLQNLLSVDHRILLRLTNGVYSNQIRHQFIFKTSRHSKQKTANGADGFL